METTAIMPILFPHTRVGEACLGDLLAVFERIGLNCAGAGDLPPQMTDALEAGRLVVYGPTGPESQDLAQLAADYRKWLEDSHGADLRVRHLQRSRPPLVEETSVARLRGQIVRGKDGTGAAEFNDNRRLAQLFLLAAAAWAAETADLQEALAEHAEKERALFTQLRGDPEALALFPMASDTETDTDPCAHLTQQWLSSWSRLMLEETAIPGVWVTLSDAVVSWMQEVFGEMREIGAVPRAALTEDGFGVRLGDFLQAIAHGRGNGGDASGGLVADVKTVSSPAMVLFDFPGVSARGAAERLLPGALPGAGDAVADSHLVLVRWY